MRQPGDGETRTAGRSPGIDLVVFDLMGTTVEDGGQVAAAFALALEQSGVTLDPNQLRAVRGASKQAALLACMPPGPDRAVRAASAYTTFCRELARRYRSDGVRPIPGAAETFAWLRTRGVRLALTTGFDREMTRLLLDALGWMHGVADAVVCGDDVPQGRPAPYLIFRAMEATGVVDVHRVATVGDTALDLQAGQHAGVRWNIGVLSGAHDRQTLGSGPHTQLLPSVAALPTLWEADPSSLVRSTEAPKG